jgi:hypothetical protein
MTGKRYGLPLALAFCLALTVAPKSLEGGAAHPGSDNAASAMQTHGSVARPVAADAQGAWSGTTWSGTFQSQHSGVSPFTMTVLIGLDSAGNLVGTTSSAADCFTDATLQVTVKGSSVVLAGSDPEGNNITFRGALDSSRTILNLSYVLNSSASGRCESDDGSGTLGKR